ncbi:hypothetical protein CC80DRAFT_133465 [Byssothecium circinans]|uniref:Uncharacterized protein n=1 Tax=Byssothecium circinans TaxID=147558 RepID=A0A6A5TTA3_9PLEO|nr:hypothetical protein CC80DRAFT_133465 [Byssothecium circinans]
MSAANLPPNIPAIIITAAPTDPSPPTFNVYPTPNSSHLLTPRRKTRRSTTQSDDSASSRCEDGTINQVRLCRPCAIGQEEEAIGMAPQGRKRQCNTSSEVRVESTVPATETAKTTDRTSPTRLDPNLQAIQNTIRFGMILYFLCQLLQFIVHWIHDERTEGS